MTNEKTQNFEKFCSILDQLGIENENISKKLNEQLASIPIEERTRLLLKVLSFGESSNAKTIAHLRLKSIFSSSKDVNSMSTLLVIATRSILVDLMIVEENRSRLAELFSTCISVIKATNKSNENMWEDISNFVISCVAKDKSYLTETIRCGLLDDATYLSSYEKKDQINGYKILIEKCIDECLGNPKVALFAIELLYEVLLKCEPNVSIESFNKLIPSLFKAMEVMIFKTQAMDYMINMTYLLTDFGEIFQVHSKIIISTINGLLSNILIDKKVMIELYEWLENFIRDFCDELKQNYSICIPDMVDNILKHHISLLPDNPEHWFEDFYASQKLLGESTFLTYTFLSEITEYLGSDIMYPLLSARAENFLSSNDWKKISTSIEIFDIIVDRFGKSIFPQPWELHHKISHTFDSRNPLIVSATIKMIGTLCCTFRDGFPEFHVEALSSVIQLVNNQNSIDVKSSSLFVIDLIMNSCIINKYEVTTNIIQPFMDVIDYILDCTHTSYMVCLSESLYLNIGCLYGLKSELVDPYIPRIITNCWKIVGKTFFTNALQRPVHGLLLSIYEAVSKYSLENREHLIGLMIKYVDEFNSAHNLPSEYLEIHPCFYSFLAHLSKYKVTSLDNLLPKLGRSIKKLIQSHIFRNKVIISNLDDEGMIPFESPFECYECFSTDYNDGHDSLWDVITKFIENYNRTFAPYIEIYFNQLLNILRDDNNISFYDKSSEGLYQLLNSSITHGDSSGAKNFWKDCLKDVLLNKLGNPVIFTKNDLILYFAKCVTINGLDGALDSEDFQILAKILNDVIENVSMMNKQLLQYENNDQKYSNCIYHDDIEISLTKLKEAIITILPKYEKDTIDIVVQIYETISAYPRTGHWEIFFKFLISMFDEILNITTPKVIEEKKLFQIVMAFSLDMLTNYGECNTLEETIQLTQRLNNLDPILFEEHVKSTPTNTKSAVEKFLMKRNNST